MAQKRICLFHWVGWFNPPDDRPNLGQESETIFLYESDIPPDEDPYDTFGREKDIIISNREAAGRTLVDQQLLLTPETAECY